MFQMLEVAKGGTGRRFGSMLGSLLLQVVLVVAAIVLPMMFTDTVSLAKTIVGTPLVAPPPPPPPAPPTSKPTQSRPTTKVKKVFVLTTPNSIPKDVPQIVDEMPIPEVAVNNGVPGGVPGGTGNVKDGVVGSIPVAPPPPPPPAKEPPKEVKVQTPQVVNVSSGVQAAKLVKKVVPIYPQLAKQARQQGTVRLTAIIGIDGSVQNLTLVSGPPLLVAAAMDAVKHWSYQPTLLNNNPVTVVTTIEVIFTLSQ